MVVDVSTLPRLAEYARAGRVVAFDTETTGCSRWDENPLLYTGRHGGSSLSSAPTQGIAPVAMPPRAF